MPSVKKDRKAAERHRRHIWENVVIRIELNAHEANLEDDDRLIDALENRPSWVRLGTVSSLGQPPVVTEVIPAARIADAGRSADELRAVTCAALLDAGIDARVWIEREWMVSPD